MYVPRPASLAAFLCFVISFAPLAFAAAQDYDAKIEALYNELDSIFGAEQVPDLFKLADSILAMDSAKISTLNIRSGYVSRVVSSGRTFGFNQFGLVPAATFYHHSGFYGGVTGYFSSEFEPQYYLTDLTAGYTKMLGRKVSVSVAHDFLLYNDTLESHYFNKSAQLTAYYQRKVADVGVDYTFLYGSEHAHRITGSVTGKVRLKTNFFIDRIAILPTFSIQYGTGNVLYVRQPRTAVSDLYQIVKQNDFPSLTLRQYLRLTYLLEQNRDAAARLFLRYHEYTSAETNKLMDLYYSGQYREENEFGLMNYAFSLPVMFSINRWNLTLNYTYNIPVALPGEMYEYEPNGYFSSSLSYQIHWVKKP
jgi:hypothetical protein